MPLATRFRLTPLRVGVLLAIATDISASGRMRTAAPETSRVGVSSAGTEADLGSASLAFSATGRFVAFDSFATNLVTGDGNMHYDVFIRDRKTRKTERMSLSSSDAEGDADSYQPAISANGRYVVFLSEATGLVAGDMNGLADIFVRDRKTRRTTRVSVSSDGTEANDFSTTPGISANGRFVVFRTSASNLAAGDGNGLRDAFVHDRVTHETERVSVADDGGEGDGDSILTNNQSAISGSGRCVVFSSMATNLVAGDTNNASDVFVRDRKTHTTRRLSVSSSGAQADGESLEPTISPSGRYVVFTSNADNLVAGDTNGTYDVFVHDRKTHETTRVDLSSDGTEAHDSAVSCGISADGRFVVLESLSADLVLHDTNQASDIFLRDRKLGTTIRLSVGPAGVEGDKESYRCALSADGRFAGFASDATNLVGDDHNVVQDTFVRGPLR